MGMFSIIILHCLECKYIHIIGTCFMFWNVSRRDKIIFSWWGGGNFFYVTTRQNNFFVVGWGQFFFMSRRDKIIFSWWVEPTKSSLFNIIWASLHHPPQENYFVSSWHKKKLPPPHHEKIILSRRDIEVGHFILTLLRPGGAEMAVTWEP